MIRINLLPIKVDRRREAGRAQILIALGIIGLEALGLFFVQMSIDSKVDAVGACVGVRGSRIKNIVEELALAD